MACMENIIAYMDTSVLKYIHVHILETTPQPPKDIRLKILPTLK